MIDLDNLKKILIAVEDNIYSDQAVHYGLALAHKLHAEVALRDVLECVLHLIDSPLELAGEARLGLTWPAGRL